MKDVRYLILFEFILMLVLIGFAIFAEKKDFLYGGIISLGLILLLLVFVLINFSSSFVVFHKLFFRNDYWLLPYDSLLITMFSSDFFYRAAVRIILYTSIFSGLSITGGLLKWRKRK